MRLQSSIDVSDYKHLNKQTPRTPTNDRPSSPPTRRTGDLLRVTVYCQLQLAPGLYVVENYIQHWTYNGKS
ncbi:hypothetical protein EVAR_48213_1 [Eumeta japonica]|uniref:Uncharacterized protein n=1 Tax=Eumeta variegata TaxID=151549 RepID=A0A4C1XXB7_EUMVA|nr:hypothetical protein EVAR_48213_1 [Eumeta japonica]